MNFLCVLLGGFIGGSLRYGFTRLIPAPYCTFVANILGLSLIHISEPTRPY